MTLNFENEVEEIKLDIDEDLQELAQRVIDASLDTLGCPYEAEVNLLITGDEQIHEMNNNFREVDRETDVLSFPMVPFEAEAGFDILDREDMEDDCFNPETGEVLLGDIVINANRVISQAQDYGHSQKREYAFLITHSMLHLCGFDHMEEEEEKRMRAKQDEILGGLNILR